MSKRSLCSLVLWNESNSKKIKLEKNETLKFHEAQNETFDLIDKIEHNKWFHEIQELIFNILYPNNKKYAKQARIKLKSFPLKQILCGVLFRNKQEEDFVFSFCKCLNELSKNMEPFLFCNFLIEEYDYKDSSNDFPIQEFFKDSIYESHHSCVFDIFSFNQRFEIENALIELIESWMKGDKKSLLLFYTNYMCNFMFVICDLEMRENSVIHDMHRMCIQNLMERIHNIDINVVNKNREIYVEMKSANAFENWNKKMNKHETQNDNEMPEDLGKTKKQIHDNVKEWHGSHPFSGLANGKSTVKQFLEILETL